MADATDARQAILEWARIALERAPTPRAVLLVHVEAVEYALVQVTDKRARTELLLEICTLGAARLAALSGSD